MYVFICMWVAILFLNACCSIKSLHSVVLFVFVLISAVIIAVSNCCFAFALYPFSLDLHNETLRWENYGDQPKSICSEPCPAGHVHNHQDICCWTCVKCREEFEYVKNDTCISCQPGWAPNERKNGCDKLKVEVIDWLSPWAYVSKSTVDFVSWK